MMAFPAAGIFYALAAAFLLGVPCGAFRAPFWLVVILGLAGAALSMWLEWRALTEPAAKGPPKDLRPRLAAAYVFLAIVGVGLVSVGYFLGEWLAAKL
jgi:hypothetical protein